MSDKKDLDREIVSVLEAQKQTGGRRKIYKEVSDQHKGEMLAADLERKIAGLRETIQRDRVAWDDLEQVQSRCLEYLQRCQEAKCLPTVGGLSVFGLGYTRQRLNAYMRENPDTPTTQFLMQVKDLLADTLETGALNRNLDSVMAIFTMKNDHDRADKLQVEPVIDSNPLGTNPDQKALEDRIMGSVVVDDE